jgi:chaperonin GroES
LSIKFLLSNIGSINLADDLEESVLTAIGNRCKRQYDEDLASMTDWTQAVTNGIELMRQEYSGKSFPWEGASNYKDPILTEASTVFGDKASLELLRAKDLVATAVIGRDPQGQKKAIGERIAEAMNYQVNYDMKGWRDEQERLFYTLPVVGAVFKKVLHDPLEKVCESVVINFPDFVVNQATRSMEKARSFTHILGDISDNDIEVRVRCGKWLDPRAPKAESTDKEGDTGSNEQQKVIDSIDNPGKFGEQNTFFDIDEDGYEEPYIITFRISDGKVVRIQARYDERSIIVKYGEGDDQKYLSVQEAMQIDEESQSKEFGGMLAKLVGITPPGIDADTYELVKVEPFQNIVKYGFITPPDNTFLDLGYSHLLGALTMGINTTTNQINDRGTLNNLGGGFLAKEFRAKQGQLRFRIGQYMQTEVPAEKLAKGIFPQPLQSADATSYNMRKDMMERSRGFLAVVDVSGKLQATTAPTTALAIIQEAIIPTTALFKRILSAASREFQILYRINQRTFPADKYRKILDDEAADPQADFNSDMMDIIPTANAEMSSKMHRIQTATLEMEQIPLVLQAGGSPAPIVKNFFDAIGSELIDQIFPEEGSMSPEDKKMQEQMLKAQEQANKIAELQLQILSREQDRLDLETREKVKKIQAEIEKIGVDMLETLANTLKLGEEAETESMKNGVTLYVEQLRTQAKAIGAIGDTNARTLALPQLPAAPNQQRAI